MATPFPKLLDLERLQSTLLTTGLQTRDNPTYQVIEQLIKAIRNLQAIVTALENVVPAPSGGGGSTEPIDSQAAIALIGAEDRLLDGDGFSYVPGPKGETGATGPAGSPGTAGNMILSGLDGLDGQDGVDSTIPGPPGVQGIPGSTGAAGVAGRNGIDGIDGEDGLTFPGPQGPQGPQGIRGSPGVDGIDNDEWNETPFVASFPIVSGSSSGTPGGSNKQVQFNDSGAFGGNSALTFDKATAILALNGLFDISAAAAGQIKFPATQNPSTNANTLDDYEEGTWTPVDASGAGLTLASDSGATALGSYVKIGQMVFQAHNVKYPATASGLAAKIGGFPFTTENPGGSPVYWGGYMTYTNSGGVTMNCNINDTKSNLYGYAPGLVSQTNTQMSTLQVDGNIQYRCTG